MSEGSSNDPDSPAAMELSFLSLNPADTLTYAIGILDTLQEALVILDADLRVLAVNRAFYDLFAVSPDATLGRPLDELGTGQWNLSDLCARLQAVLTAGQPVRNVEVTSTFPDLGSRTMLLNARRLVHQVDALGATLLLTIQDVSGLKQVEGELDALRADLEERVRRRTAELAAANAELEAFSYSVSHDLRTPLRAMDGFARALVEDYEALLDDDGKDYVRRIRAAAQQMADLIDDLLGLSRITRSDMHYERINLSAMAAAILDERRASEPEHHVAVTIQEDLWVDGDRALLKVLLTNLLENAWKYSRPVPEPHITFQTVRNEDETVYCIRDNGVGFDMAYAHHLFTPFQRLHTAYEFEGNGIGLATAQRILKRHGGRIWAESPGEDGAAFFFTLNHTASP